MILSVPKSITAIIWFGALKLSDMQYNTLQVNCHNALQLSALFLLLHLSFFSGLSTFEHAHLD